MRRYAQTASHLWKGIEMKKFASLLLVVAALGMAGVVGCNDNKSTPPAAPATTPPASGDKMTPAAPAPASTPAPTDTEKK